MKRAALFVAGFVVLGACANDFDALTTGKSELTPAESSHEDPPPTADATTPAADDCAAKKCEPITTKSDGELVVATECCSYSCTNEISCEFQVLGAKAKLDCLTSECKMTCGSNAGCELDCKQSDSCDVTCDASSKCVVRNCGDACDVTCGDGSNAQVCDKGTRACGGCP